MEAAGELGRGGLASAWAAVGALARSRSRAFWIVAGVTLLAAGLRFATLGAQAYHHDEVVTASRVLRGSFWHAMDAVGFSESAPPLYYALAWLWTQMFGTGEAGLRSLSALAGVATVPVAYLLGAELRGRRAGIAAALLVAVNPMLLWYSQEARAYALLVLLTALATLFFVRAYAPGRANSSSRDATAWGVCSALALATHYFAVFPLAAQALLLWRRRGREALAGLAIVLAAGLALAPLAIYQMLAGRAEWIGVHGLAHRLWEVAASFAVGETGDVIARAESVLPALVPLAAALAAFALLAARGQRPERRAAGLMLVFAAATVALPLAIALAFPDKDFVLARNLLPALVPLLVALGVAVTVPAARRLGTALGAVLVAYSIGFSLAASSVADLQRPDWRAAAAALGEPEAPRAIVSWTLGHASLRYYLSTGSFQARPEEGFSWFVHEVVFVSLGRAPAPPARLLGPRFRPAGEQRVGELHLRRYAVPGGQLVPLRLRAVRRARLGFRSNDVLVDGIGVS